MVLVVISSPLMSRARTIAWTRESFCVPICTARALVSKEGIIGAAGDAPDDATEVAKPIEPAEVEGWGTGDASGHALGQGTTGDDEVIAGVLGQPLSG